MPAIASSHLFKFIILRTTLIVALLKILEVPILSCQVSVASDLSMLPSTVVRLISSGFCD